MSLLFFRNSRNSLCVTNSGLASRNKNSAHWDRSASAWDREVVPVGSVLISRHHLRLRLEGQAEVILQVQVIQPVLLRQQG
jgi:hypothetical protein